jgi:crossover junction endodeoxyribonuclease RuvC
VRILGLDPGLTYTGWAVISVGRHLGVQWACEALGRIHTKPQQDLGERLAVLHQKILEVCTQWQPTVAAIEQIFVNSNPASALKLGLARGVVFMTPAHYGISVKEYSANTVKKCITGNGHANKEQVLQMIQYLFKITPEQYDSSDALAVAACHHLHVR